MSGGEKSRIKSRGENWVSWTEMLTYNSRKGATRWTRKKKTRGMKRGWSRMGKMFEDKRNWRRDSSDTVKERKNEWRINEIVRIYRWNVNDERELGTHSRGPNICDQFIICRSVACNVCFVALWIRIICIKLAWNWWNDAWNLDHSSFHAIGRKNRFWYALTNPCKL